MEYNVRLEFNEPIPEAHEETLIDKYLAAFSPFHPAVSRSILGRLEVWITIQAESTAQAAIIGPSLTTSFGPALVALEVMTSADFDKLVGLVPVPELINAGEAAEILGISAAAVGQKFTNGQLPGQRVGERTIVFARRDIEAAAAGRRTVIANVGSGEVVGWANSIEEATVATQDNPDLYAREVKLTESSWE